MQGPSPRTVVIGAGVGGLAAALRLQAAGHRVTLFDSHSWPGGKIRSVTSQAGPVDAGPTVLTMRGVFDDLFVATGTQLDDHVTLVAEPLLARHFWPDGSSLDLTADMEQNTASIERFSGKASAREFQRFAKDAAHLFEMFRAPMMESPEPDILRLAQVSLANPRQWPTLVPFAKLRNHLTRRFSDRRLAQLFGRYATYVGGSPLASPALLALIWQAEATGIWRVQGGMHRLSAAMAERFQALGGNLRLACSVSEIHCDKGRMRAVSLENGTRLDPDLVVFAGDPRALASGRLGPDVSSVARQTLTTRRSLSARVWSFAAQVTGPAKLAHHNVFFGTSATAEFEDLAGGAVPTDPTIYLCAEDRGTDMPEPTGPERFEIILNAAPLTDAAPRPDEEDRCRQMTFQILERFGVTFDPVPPTSSLATPTTFETLFPGSAGALYGQSPHGTTAALQRPRARTSIKGLYLAGGGAHPGAGVPMAALSGRHAAEAILKDHVST